MSRPRQNFKPSRLEVPAERLLALDGLEESFEVALTEADGAVTLDHLEEEGRAILGRLREDLKQVSLVVAVGQDLQPPKRRPLLVDLAHSLLDVLVVGVRRVEEADAALAQ